MPNPNTERIGKLKILSFVIKMTAVRMLNPNTERRKNY